MSWDIKFNEDGTISFEAEEYDNGCAQAFYHLVNIFDRKPINFERDTEEILWKFFREECADVVDYIRDLKVQQVDDRKWQLTIILETPPSPSDFSITL